MRVLAISLIDSSHCRHYFLRSNENAHCRLKSLGIKIAVRGLTSSSERSEDCRRCCRGRDTPSRDSWILPIRAFAGVPFVDRGIELHSRIAAEHASLGDFTHQHAEASLSSQGRPSITTARPPFAAFVRRFHEFVAYPQAQVFVLIHDRAVGVAVVTAVVTCSISAQAFFSSFCLASDELFDVRMPSLSVFIFAARRVSRRSSRRLQLIVNFRGTRAVRWLWPHRSISLSSI